MKSESQCYTHKNEASLQLNPRATHVPLIHHGTELEKPVPQRKGIVINIPELPAENLQSDLGQVTPPLPRHQRWLVRYICIPRPTRIPATSASWSLSAE